MRVGSIGGALLLVAAAITAGCATAPAASSGPAESASAAPRPVPSTVASAAPGSPAPAGSTVPTASPEPVVLEADGATTDEIVAGRMTFVAKDGGRATCRSLPDSREVGDVTALELGELGPGTLRATLGLAGPSLEVFVDGGDLPDGSFQPFWTGPVAVTPPPAEGGRGMAVFTQLRLEADPGSKPGSSPAGTGDWPDTLSGTISWLCGAWDVPDASGAPPPSIAP